MRTLRACGACVRCVCACGACVRLSGGICAHSCMCVCILYACCGAKLLAQIPPPNHFNQSLNP